MTEPYSSPPGYHRHSCPECGFIWEHEDIMPETTTLSRHHCPACGECSTHCYVKYTGDSAPEQTTQPQEATP